MRCINVLWHKYAPRAFDRWDLNLGFKARIKIQYWQWSKYLSEKPESLEAKILSERHKPLLEKIGHYPEFLKRQMLAILRQPLVGHLRLSGTVHNLLLPQSQTVVKDQEWAIAGLQPCIFMAVVFRNARGAIIDARAGHWSTDFNCQDIHQLAFPPENCAKTTIWAAGLSEKSSAETLRNTVNRLFNEFNKTNPNLSLRWFDEEQPEIIDAINEQPITDFGFGLLINKEKNQQAFITRRVAFGVAGDKAIFACTVFADFPGQHIGAPLRTQIFTEDAGLITIIH